jgi:hypothetical protein
MVGPRVGQSGAFPTTLNYRQKPAIAELVLRQHCESHNSSAFCFSFAYIMYTSKLVYLYCSGAYRVREFCNMHDAEMSFISSRQEVRMRIPFSIIAGLNKSSTTPMHDLVLYAEMTDRQPAEVCSITCEEDRSSLPMNRMTLPL